MEVPRQGALSQTSGRINQKRRTRSAIVAAAQQILDRGETPTVAQAAEDALVSRTTAYRYFPTQESLLLELSVNIDVRELDDFVVDSADMPANERLLTLWDLFNRHAFANERLYRTAVRHYMDAWLAADRTGETDYVVREGRRTRYLATCLDPLRDTTPNEKLDRLEAALCLVAGAEAMTVMRDVCRIDDDEQALAILRWATEALLEVGLRTDDTNRNGDSSKRTTPARRRRKPATR